MEDLEKKRAQHRFWYARRKAGLGSPNPGRPASTSDVIWSKVDKRGEDECWNWLGYKNEQGYGRTWIDGIGYYAHRVIYNLAKPNEITLNAPKSTKDSEFVLHTCDNPSCCNPKHLWLGTHADNMQDKKAKNRGIMYPRDTAPRCKLTMEQAREARQLRKDGHTIVELCEKFKLSRASMKTLLRGDSYKE